MQPGYVWHLSKFSYNSLLLFARVVTPFTAVAARPRIQQDPLCHNINHHRVCFCTFPKSKHLLGLKQRVVPSSIIHPSSFVSAVDHNVHQNIASHRQSIDEINVTKREAGRFNSARHRLLTSGRITSREPRCTDPTPVSGDIFALSISSDGTADIN